MEGHSSAVLSLLVHNRLMYTGAADSTAKCWVTEFGECTRQYKGHKHSVIVLVFEKGVCELSFYPRVSTEFSERARFPGLRAPEMKKGWEGSFNL